jgi:hypothetical protein
LGPEDIDDILVARWRLVAVGCRYHRVGDNRQAEGTMRFAAESICGFVIRPAETAVAPPMSIAITAPNRGHWAR